jgi:hypothetical protein
MWELQVFFHSLPHLVPVQKILSYTKMYFVEPEKSGFLIHANAAVTQHIPLLVHTHPFAFQV